MKSNTKSRMHSVKHMKGLLLVGLVLMAAGAVAEYMIPDGAHMASRIAGFVSGIGSAFMLTGGVLLLRRWRLGEKRAKEEELAMTDERGLAVAYKAQSVAAIAAVFALMGVSVLALARGDELYAVVCGALLLAVALVKLLAWYVYNRIM